MVETRDLSTRERLIVAAGELFGEKGYHATSIREICARAEANVAAIHYHFHDKAKLSEEVLVHVFSYGFEHYRLEQAANPEWPPERQLQEFIRLFLWSRLDPDRPDWHRKVVHREMLEPGPNLKAVAERVIKRNAHILEGIVRAVLGDRAPESTVRLCMASIIGQCLHFAHFSQVVAHLNENIDFSPSGIRNLAGHVAAFSLAALRNLPGDPETSNTAVASEATSQSTSTSAGKTLHS
jgi:AcrR family transcriptional regulator